MPIVASQPLNQSQLSTQQSIVGGRMRFEKKNNQQMHATT
jgi:hypothetical protein